MQHLSRTLDNKSLLRSKILQLTGSLMFLIILQQIIKFTEVYILPAVVVATSDWANNLTLPLRQILASAKPTFSGKSARSSSSKRDKGRVASLPAG